MAVYVTQATFDLYVQTEFGANASETALRASALSAGEAAIDEYCQRSFSVASGSSARLYVPDGTDVLRIHDCTSVSAVTYDGVAVSSSDYQLEPVNARSWSNAVRPYLQIRYLTSVWTANAEALVSVTAAWGWAAIPAAVVEATLIVGKDILQQRRTAGNAIAAGDFVAPVRLNTYVRQLLSPLRRVEAFGIA